MSNKNKEKKSPWGYGSKTGSSMIVPVYDEINKVLPNGDVIKVKVHTKNSIQGGRRGWRVERERFKKRVKDDVLKHGS